MRHSPVSFGLAALTRELNQRAAHVLVPTPRSALLATVSHLELMAVVLIGEEQHTYTYTAILLQLWHQASGTTFTNNDTPHWATLQWLQVESSAPAEKCSLPSFFSVVNQLVQLSLSLLNTHTHTQIQSHKGWLHKYL